MVRKFQYSFNAFTILEILVVVSVVVVLTAIAIPRFSGVQDLGKKSQAEAELKTLQLAVTSYYLNHNPHVYPPTTPTVGASYLIAATPKILKTVLYDPFGSTLTTEYNYMSSSNHLYYYIWSASFHGDSVPASITNTGVVNY